jgi:dipeptidyl aminopeptidase/acylaminoacyl peptidase
MTYRTVAFACLVAAWCLPPAPAPGQGTRADYERANGLRQRWEGKVYRDRVRPHWYAHDTRFWYRNDLPGGEWEFIRVDALHGRREAAFDHEKLAVALQKETDRAVTANKLPLDGLAFGDEDAMRFRAFGKDWHCSLANYRLRAATPDAIPPDAEASSELRPTRDTGPAVQETFVNRTGGPVKMFWSDFDGRLQSYGDVAPGGESQMNTYVGHVWVLTDAADGILAVLETPRRGGRFVVDDTLKSRGRAPLPRPRSSADSPDGAWTARVKDHNVWVRHRKTGEDVRLSREGTAEDGYDSDFFWSPDGSKLVALRTRRGEEHKVYLVESSPPDQVQPKLHALDYLKPGDRIPVTKPHLFDVGQGKEIPIADELFPRPWEIGDVRWQPDGKRFTFRYNQRGHQVLRVVGVDAADGHAVALVEEQSKTFIDYAGKFFAHYLDATGELLWMSERDGWNHLYLYDLRAGKVKNQVTRGEWVVRGVDRVDADKRQVWFRAGGIHPGQDPYFVHHARVNFDGTGLVLLTDGDGTHTIDYSPEGKFYLDTCSRVDLPPVTELRRTEDGKRVCELERADVSALEAAGWHAPEPFTAAGRDGKTPIYGVIYRPTNFDPDKRYPVVEEIYAGPQGSFVPKAFRAFHPPQALAELGFVVVQIDGMGTSNRSKAFHDVCRKNLGDAGFPDRILWLRAAAKKYPYLDLDRVGIYGGSAGGQNALRALLAHGDFYKVAVADCGCHDNRMDKIWWNELWMGWPVGPHYAEQSNVTQAHRLQGKLLLVVGELDRNVDPASTMQVVNALVKADKDFDLLVVPGAGHGAAESPYGVRRRQDFFVRHLLGVEPRRGQ